MTDSEKTDIESLSFEESLKRLEEIVSLLESGKTDLSVSLERYEEGVRLLRRCRLKLDDAGRKIEMLKNLDETGPLQTEPVDLQTLQSDNAAPGHGTVRRKKSAARAKKSAANEGNTVSGDVKTQDADDLTDTESTSGAGLFDFGEQ